MAVFLHGLRLPRFNPIKLRSLCNDFLDAIDLRAVRVFRRLAFCVVLAVNGHPFLGYLPRGQPKPEAKKMTWNRVQIQPAMRLRAMQVDGDRCNRYVRQCECDNDVSPPRQIDQACRKKIRDIQRVVLQKNGFK